MYTLLAVREPCPDEKHLCSLYAECTVIGFSPVQYQCVCKAGFSGDGTVCEGKVLQLIINYSLISIEWELTKSRMVWKEGSRIHQNFQSTVGVSHMTC